MKRKIKVAVLMGGRSPEHEISIISGSEVVDSLDKTKYDVLPIVISKSGDRWQLVSSSALSKIRNPLSLKGTGKELVTSSKQVGGIQSLKGRLDVVFIAMHGPYGEDGTIQGMFDLAGIKYTGCGLLASAVGMDKLRFRKALEAEKIKVPRYSVVRKGESILKVYNSLLNPPWFVKPHNQGSSVGMSLVKDKGDMNKAISHALEYSDTILVDEYIKGIEVTCGILGNDQPYALPLVEIVPIKGEYFNYDSKYTESGAEEIVPARISKKLTSQIQSTALRIYKLLNCKGFSRVDFIIRNKNTPYVLEINTIPGLTPMSLFPKAAKAHGLSYSQLLDRIVTYATRKTA